MHKKYMAQILNVTIGSVYNYERENRPIIKLLDYFTDDDAIELLETGKISKMENVSLSTLKLENIENILIDNAIYSAKQKLKDVFENSGLVETLIIKGINLKNKFKEVILDMENYTIENAKTILLEKISGLEITLKERVLSKIVNKYFSNIEIYAICKYTDETFDYSMT